MFLHTFVYCSYCGILPLSWHSCAVCLHSCALALYMIKKSYSFWASAPSHQSSAPFHQQCQSMPYAGVFYHDATSVTGPLQIHTCRETFFFFQSCGHKDCRDSPVDTNRVQLSLSSVIITAALMSLSHHTMTSSVHSMQVVLVVLAFHCPQSIIWHSANVTEQLKLSLSNGVHRCPLLLYLTSHFIVCYTVLPFDFQYSSVAPHLKRQQPIYAGHLSSFSTFLLHTKENVKPGKTLAHSKVFICNIFGELIYMSCADTSLELTCEIC